MDTFYNSLSEEELLSIVVATTALNAPSDSPNTKSKNKTLEQKKKKKRISKIPDEYQVDYRRFKILDTIAEGGFAVVHRATLKRTNKAKNGLNDASNQPKIVAIKVYKTQHKWSCKNFRNEVRSYPKLGSHDNILQFYGASLVVCIIPMEHLTK